MNAQKGKIAILLWNIIIDQASQEFQICIIKIINAMTQFEVPKKEAVSAKNQEVFSSLEKALGGVPNLYATMAYSASGLSKYLAFQNAPSSLSIKEKEAIHLVVSQVNDCKYCLSAHTLIAKMNGFPDEEILKIRSGNATDAKLDALVTFAKSVTENKGRVPEGITAAFFAAGYDKGNMVDVIMQVSDKIASNYLHNLTQVPVDFPLAPGL